MSWSHELLQFVQLNASYAVQPPALLIDGGALGVDPDTDLSLPSVDDLTVVPDCDLTLIEGGPQILVPETDSDLSFWIEPPVVPDCDLTVIYGNSLDLIYPDGLTVEPDCDLTLVEGGPQILIAGTDDETDAVIEPAMVICIEPPITTECDLTAIYGDSLDLIDADGLTVEPDCDLTLVDYSDQLVVTTVCDLTLLTDADSFDFTDSSDVVGGEPVDTPIRICGTPVPTDAGEEAWAADAGALDFHDVIDALFNADPAYA